MDHKVIYTNKENQTCLLSVIIPIHTPERVKYLLKSMSNLRCSNKIEIILITNDKATYFHLRKEVKNIPVNYVKVVFNERYDTPAKARNAGINMSKGKYISCLDSDIIVDRSWCEKAIDVISNYDYCFIQGQFTEEANPDNFWGIFEGFTDLERFKFFNVKKNFCSTLDCRNFVGLKEKLIKCGLFDESLPSGEDRELGYRLYNNGYNIIFYEDLKVRHYYPQTLIGIIKRKFWHAKGLALVYTKKKNLLPTKRMLTFLTFYLFVPLRKYFQHYKTRNLGKFLIYYFFSSIIFILILIYFMIINKFGGKSNEI